MPVSAVPAEQVQQKVLMLVPQSVQALVSLVWQPEQERVPVSVAPPFEVANQARQAQPESRGQELEPQGLQVPPRVPPLLVASRLQGRARRLLWLAQMIHPARPKPTQDSSEPEQALRPALLLPGNSCPWPS